MRRMGALILLVVLTSTRIGVADDAAKPAGPKVDAALATRMAALKARAGVWLEARRTITGKCARCGGDGKISIWTGRYYRHDTCPTCNGQCWLVGKKQWQAVHYDLLTPEKRKTLKLDEVMAPLRTVPYTFTDTGKIKESRIDRVELVGAKYGRVLAFESGETVAKPSLWVETEDSPSKVSNWFVYSEDADGAFPDTAAPGTDPLPVDSQKLEPLAAAELDPLRAKLGLSEAHASLDFAQRLGRTLVISMFDRAPTDAAALDESIRNDIVPLTRAALAALPDVESVRIVFLARWRDKYGSVEKKSYKTAEIARAEFGKIHFDVLSADQVHALYEIKETLPLGEVMYWKADKDSDGPDPKK